MPWVRVQDAGPTVTEHLSCETREMLPTPFSFQKLGGLWGPFNPLNLNWL